MARNPDKKKCGAKTRSGGVCDAWAMPNGRCRLHGGKSLGGLMSGTFKHGRYSKYLPTRMLDRYRDAQDDTELLAMREEIALLDARLTDVLSRVDTGEAGELWSQARDAYSALTDALQKKDADGINYSMVTLGRLLGRGQADWAAWREITNLLEQRRKLVESERKRLVEMQQMITAEQAVNYASALALAVKEHVTDPGLLSKINEDFRRLLSRNDQHPPAG